MFCNRRRDVIFNIFDTHHIPYVEVQVYNTIPNPHFASLFTQYLSTSISSPTPSAASSFPSPSPKTTFVFFSPSGVDIIYNLIPTLDTSMQALFNDGWKVAIGTTTAEAMQKVTIMMYMLLYFVTCYIMCTMHEYVQYSSLLYLLFVGYVGELACRCHCFCPKSYIVV